MRWRGLFWRSASIVVVGPVLLAALYVGGYFFIAAVVASYLLAAHEWSRMCNDGGSIPVSWLNFFGGLPILWLGYQGSLAHLGPVLALLLAVNLAVPPLIGLSGGTVGMDMFGQIYLGLPLAFLLMLRHLGFAPAAAALALVWGNDVMAYMVGSIIGRHKMMPRLSPNKTWEGTVGGVLGGALVGFLLSGWLHLPAWHGTLIGLAAGVLAVLGDLSESAIKRWARTKDSGVFLPGHGGMLDRIDSLLFALPALYYLLRF